MLVEAISNGMGSQSMMLVILAAEHKIPARLSITADTGSELDRVWSTGERTTAKDYFDRVIEPFANDNGIEAVFVRAQDKNGDDLPPIIDLMMQGQTVGVPLFGNNGGRLNQHCTEKYKIRAVRQELRRRKAKTARVALGLTMGEVHRIRPSDVAWCVNYWPLIELGLYRKNIQDELTKRGIPFLLSTECDMCPHKDRARWDRTAPDVIDRIARIEQNMPGLYFTPARVPLKQALNDHGAQQLDLFDTCDSGYCFV